MQMDMHRLDVDRLDVRAVVVYLMRTVPVNLLRNVLTYLVSTGTAPPMADLSYMYVVQQEASLVTNRSNAYG